MRTEPTRVIASFVASLLLAIPATASAQLAWEMPAPSYPRTFSTRPLGASTTPMIYSGLVLTPGATYAVETVELAATASYADAVVTVLSPSSAVLGGADGLSACYTMLPAWQPSMLAPACARFAAPAAYPGFATTFVNLLVRAWTSTSGGTMRLRIRQMASPTASVPTDNFNCSVGTTTVTSGCWTVLTPSAITFGGVISSIGTAAAQINIRTREDVYSASSTGGAQTLWFVGNNSDASSNWNLLTSSNAYAGDVPGNAQYLGPIPSGAQTVFAQHSGANNIVLQRNDRVPGAPGVGVDFDDDTLGANLEALLRTCDSPTTPSPSGFTCNLRDCNGTPTSAQCRTSLNDSDRDGIPDPVDLYGAYSGYGLHMRLGRMGCSPSQYDVLVEADAQNNDVLAPPNTCSFADGDTVDWREALQIGNTYLDSGTQVPNRNGRQGIQVHVDIPLPTFASILSTQPAWVAGVGESLTCLPIGMPCRDGQCVNSTCSITTHLCERECLTNADCPESTCNTGSGRCSANFAGCISGTQDPRGGYWGGASCARDRPCSAGCSPGDTCTPNLPICDISRTSCATNADCPPGGGVCVDPVDTCSSNDQRLEFMHSGRRWLFHHSKTFNGAGNGDMPGMTSSCGPEVLRHELGHNGGLGHGAPALAFDDQDTTNGRPNHNSVMNYLFQNYGFRGTQDENPGNPNEGATVLTLPRLAQLSFSDGTMPVLDPRAVPENCPFGSAASHEPLYENYEPITRITDVNANWLVSAGGSPVGCRNVDWDGDGNASLPAGQTLEAPLWLASYQRTRRAASTAHVFTALDQPADMVMLGTTLHTFRLQRAPNAGGDVLTLATASSFACSSTPGPSSARWPVCDLGAHADAVQPIAINPSLNVARPNGAFAAETSVRASDNTQVAVVVWRNGSTGLSVGVYKAGSVGFDFVGTVTGATPSAFPVTATSDGTQLLALARLGETQALSLLYRASDGNILEQVMTWTGNMPAWSSPVVVVGSQSIGSPGSTRLASGAFAGIPAGIVMALPLLDGSFDIYSRTHSAPTGTWTLRDNIRPSDATLSRGQPQLAVSPTRQGTAINNHLWVTVGALQAGVFGQARVARSQWGSLSFGAPEYWGQIWGNEAVPTAATPALLRDERQPPGLRGIVPRYEGCSTGCPSGSICTTVDGSPACVADGRFVLVTETLSTGMDGLTPGSFNEYPAMLRQFCANVRLVRSYAPVPWNSEPGDSCPNAPVF